MYKGEALTGEHFRNPIKISSFRLAESAKVNFTHTLVRRQKKLDSLRT